ncbi:hypothetical protein ACFPAF_11390 [Hymenobacter endophyticus]|uniref:Type 1 periplasmic binding fold superfamily protein n=1 Tax=Hymenobacter endophyticus TaxID=3076335 RepID=A0ABU3TI36_9BACT|nr:hypothetical protein [Hymenobacter endophyticus]MDU0371000.1 hypothetical protein [Hymenobacter endophyticus]
MNNLLFRSAFLAALAAAPLLSSCSDDNDTPTPDDDNEQITTVRYELTPTTGGSTLTAQYRDVDGDGGAAPVISGLTLAANTTYTGKIVLLDETKTPAEDISAEVKEEADEHLFVYTPSNVNLTVTRTDKDKNNLEVGLETRLQTAAASATAGTLRVTLRHQPGTKNGSATPGDTDVEVDFPVTVK